MEIVCFCLWRARKTFPKKSFEIVLTTSYTILLISTPPPPPSPPYGDLFSTNPAPIFFYHIHLLSFVCIHFIYYNLFLFMIICKNLFLSVIICQNHFLFMIICENLFLFMLICENLFLQEPLLIYDHL